MEFALFCKTFRRDLDRFEHLYESVLTHDQDMLPFIVSVPEEDLVAFRSRFGTERLSLLTDEQILGGALKKVRQGWKNQQLVKLLFWRQRLADAWLVLDADFYFVRDFSRADFVRGHDTVAMVASRAWHSFDHNAETLGDYLREATTIPAFDLEEAQRNKAAGHRPPWIAWERLRDRIRQPDPQDRGHRVQSYFGRSGAMLTTIPGPVWTLESLSSFESAHLAPRRLTFLDLLHHAPWEASWIGEWEVSRGCPHRFLVEPYFIHFSSDEAIEAARAAGWTSEDFGARYLGLALAAGHQQIQRL